MGLNPFPGNGPCRPCHDTYDDLVDKNLGQAYKIVRFVYDNWETLEKNYDLLIKLPEAVWEFDPDDYATALQGTKADTAVQPGQVSAVGFSGSYADLLNKPTLGSAADKDVSYFATAAQGAKADSAVQPDALATVATSGKFGDLTERPTSAQGTLTALPSTAIVGSKYYATDTREMYEYDSTGWQVMPIGGAVVASLAVEVSTPLTGHDLAAPAALPGLNLTFVAGNRPVVIGFGASFRNGGAGQTALMQLQVNGVVRTQIFHTPPGAGVWGTYYRRTRPLSFTPGSVVTVVLLGAAEGTVNGEVFGASVDPVTIEVVLA